MGDIIFSLVMGQDAFTGKKINSVQEGEASALIARSKHLLRKLTPNNHLIGDFGLFPDEQSFRSYSQRKIIRALNSGEARGRLPGRYDLPVLQAVAQTIGIKMHPFEPRVEEQLRTLNTRIKFLGLSLKPDGYRGKCIVALCPVKMVLTQSMNYSKSLKKYYSDIER